MAITGRKSKYATHVEPRLETIRAWRSCGVTEKDIAKNLGVSERTFADYKKQFPQLLQVLKTGLDDANAIVQNALYRRASGYTYEEVETTVVKDAKDLDAKELEAAAKDGKKPTGKVTVKRVQKQMAPDVTAAIFILQNRDRAHWKDRRAIDLGGPDGEPLQQGVLHLFLPKELPHPSTIKRPPNPARENAG